MTEHRNPLIFRPATPEDVSRIEAIIARAKERMREAGKRQWQDGYPSRPDIDRDILRGYGYVLASNHEAIAYGAILFDGEPAYEALDGTWTQEPPYVAVHRLAVADDWAGRGLAVRFMQEAETLARQKGIAGFRVDTNFDNDRMLRVLSGLGFGYRGDIQYRGDARMAFEKTIAPEKE